ncbi:MAG: efflux RND transporter permease subunit [bacterium]
MKIIDFSIRRRVTVSMVTLAVVIFGFVAFNRLDVTLLPNLTYPTLTIRTEYLGAAPVEVENLVTKPIEEALGVVKNLIEVRSISRSGQSDVILEFEWGTNMDYAGLEVREKLDALDLPLEVKKPLVLRFDPSLDPIVTLALYRQRENQEKSKENIKLANLENSNSNSKDDLFDESNLKYLRTLSEEQLKKELESIQGVAAVKISGGLEEEIQIEVDQGKLAQLNLTIQEVARRLRQENVNLAGGSLKEGTHQYLVRTLNQFKSVDEIRNVILRAKEGSKIYLKDIANVIEGYKERKAITRIDGVEAVEIAIYKEGDANTVTVARAMKKRLKPINKLLPEGSNLKLVYDQSIFIENSVNEVINAAVIGGILAFFVLYFFLRNIWSTVIICLAIPISVIATFNLMFGGHITLNIMSLGGIALGIGMLVDNSIVVLESIFRYREKGDRTIDAAQLGASEVGMAVTASTLTTIAVFFPLVFVKGIAGQLFRDQALTVTFSLLASLAVALTLIPLMASLGGKKNQALEFIQESEKHKRPHGKIVRGLKRFFNFIFSRVPTFFLTWVIRITKVISNVIKFLATPVVNIFEKAFDSVNKKYPKFLDWALSHRLATLGIAIGLFVLSMLLIPKLGVELIPQLSQGEFIVEVKLPPGTPLKKTDGLIERMQREAHGNKMIHTMFSVAGMGNRLDANPEAGGENWGELRVKMASGSDRSDEERLMTELRSRFSRLAGAEYKFTRPTLFTFKTPIEVEVAGYDLKGLKELSDIIARNLEENPKFTDIKSTMKGGYPEIQIYFDRERIASYGLQVPQVAQTVVNKVKGELATRYSLRDRKIDVLVRAREKDRESIENIRRMLVNPVNMPPITLASVANVIVDMGPGEIHRSGQQRVALVRANLVGHDLGGAAEDINGLISSLRAPEEFNIRLAGQSNEMAVSFQSLRFALLFAIFLVYLVMASQFESLLHPFVIMFTIPLALIGVVFALLLTGNSISVVVFIGLIMLAGIVVNNAIVLIDYINQRRRKGLAKLEAIKEAGQVRLRPIMMTTLTTALGLLPLALGLGEGAEVRAPMAITVIGGLLVSTMLTLVVIPVVYSIVDRKA